MAQPPAREVIDTVSKVRAVPARPSRPRACSAAAPCARMRLSLRARRRTWAVHMRIHASTTPMQLSQTPCMAPLKSLPPNVHPQACAYGDFDALRRFVESDPGCVNSVDEQVCTRGESWRAQTALAAAVRTERQGRGKQTVHS